MTDGTSSIALQRASSVGIVNKHFVVIGNNWSPLLVLDQSSLANFPRHKVCTPPNPTPSNTQTCEAMVDGRRSEAFLGLAVMECLTYNTD